MVTFEVVVVEVCPDAPAVSCPPIGGMSAGLLLKVQRLLETCCIVTGETVVGSSRDTSGPPLESLPGDAFMSCEPHTGQTMSEHDTLDGWDTSTPQLGHTHASGLLARGSFPAVSTVSSPGLPLGGIVGGCPR